MYEVNEPRALSVRMMQDAVVKDRSGRDLGEIKDLAIDSATGRIVYVVLSLASPADFAPKLLAMPWPAFLPPADEPLFVLDVQREILESAPALDTAHRPEKPGRRWIAELYNHYGYTFNA